MGLLPKPMGLWYYTDVYKTIEIGGVLLFDAPLTTASLVAADWVIRDVFCHT